MQCRVNTIVSTKYFSDITPSKREYSSFAIKFLPEQKKYMSTYSWNGIQAKSVSGYQYVNVTNIYDCSDKNRIQKHFSCGHDIANDEKILMTLKSISGIDIQTLSEKEIVAKSIECEYLRKIN